MRELRTRTIKSRQCQKNYLENIKFPYYGQHLMNYFYLDFFITSAPFSELPKFNKIMIKVIFINK